jgi:hypothetical protein
MTLESKVTSLKLGAVAAGRVALFWENAIKVHGHDKATAFYKSLGLNHLETKGVEWEGLTLSREPTEAEKLCVKGIANAQETAKEQIGKILTVLRSSLITQGLGAIARLQPKDFHTLILEVPEGEEAELRALLDSVYHRGRVLVAQELGKKQDAIGDSADELDTLADLTDARIVNEVQSRITAAAARYRLLGLSEDALWTAITQEIADGSVSYIDRAATGLANRVINIGRGDEMRSRSREIERYEYSALLDQNTCGPCLADDGKEANSPDELPDTPNPECEGSDYCRCFIVAIAEGNM